VSPFITPVMVGRVRPFSIFMIGTRFCWCVALRAAIATADIDSYVPGCEESQSCGSRISFEWPVAVVERWGARAWYRALPTPTRADGWWINVRRADRSRLARWWPGRLVCVDLVADDATQPSRHGDVRVIFGLAPKSYPDRPEWTRWRWLTPSHDRAASTSSPTRTSTRPPRFRLSRPLDHPRTPARMGAGGEAVAQVTRLQHGGRSTTPPECWRGRHRDERPRRFGDGRRPIQQIPGVTTVPLEFGARRSRLRQASGQASTARSYADRADER